MPEMPILCHCYSRLNEVTADYTSAFSFVSAIEVVIDSTEAVDTSSVVTS